MGEALKKFRSKYVGVHWSKAGKKHWYATTGGGNKNRRNHGCYATENEAARVRNQMMIERFGFDPRPNIIEGSEESVTRYSVSGDVEFVIRAINHMRLRGAGTLHINNRPGEMEHSLRARMKPLMPLLIAQPYIVDVLFNSNVVCHVNLNECDADFTGQIQPWLSVPEIRKVRRVLFHRSHTLKPAPASQWIRIAKRIRGEYAFVGAKTGAQILRTQTRIPFLPVSRARNLLEAAQIIAGADLFVGNESPMAEIARGLGIRVAIEGTKEFDDLSCPNYLENQSHQERDCEFIPGKRYKFRT